MCIRDRHTRGVPKRIAKDQETEEDRREEEAEIVTEGEMEQQAGDKEEARGDMDLLKLWELIKGDSKKQKEANNEIFNECRKTQGNKTSL